MLCLVVLLCRRQRWHFSLKEAEVRKQVFARVVFVLKLKLALQKVGRLCIALGLQDCMRTTTFSLTHGNLEKHTRI
ncbi:MAG: hypothetical protein UU98_C0002G0023 [Parcubacteria group bacterium GW2011_GWD2_42_14]|nr:MAG: hypothetical protein UU98_C0002G0023 [Parcubacteria group bacterium GW2011_GWD2_42_14]